MSICLLTHVAATDPAAARKRILSAADDHDGKTRPTAKALGVSYCTLLRLLDRLDMRREVRELWANRKREARAAGRA